MPRKKRIEPIKGNDSEPRPINEAFDALLKSKGINLPAEQPPAPEPEQPPRKVKSWGETVRGWHGHGATGVHHVTTTSPNMVGLRFDKGKERTPEEKREMEAIGLRFFNEAQAWLKTNRDGAFDETKDLGQRFADRRRQEVSEGQER